jgi:DNA invertase Pin-like site-specific DNA recombinase
MVGILGYARVSTHQQDLESQRHRLRKAGAIKLFTDIISGKIFNRPGLDELIAYARPNDLLCVVRLDRLGRSLKELLETVEHLKTNKIGLMSLEEKIDTSSAAGELVFHVFGAIAHFERRLISERTKDGIYAARLKGKIPGRPGLNKDILDAALKLTEAGLSPTNIAKQLQIGRSTLYRELKYTRSRIIQD